MNFKFFLDSLTILLIFTFIGLWILSESHRINPNWILGAALIIVMCYDVILGEIRR